ncbi:hypothetical protein BVX99_02395, partial [bacterium F16]
TGQVILEDSYKAWHFGHDAGTLDDLEVFFQNIASDIPCHTISPVMSVTKYDDLYTLLDDVEKEIGWAQTVDGLAALIGAQAEYRNGEGPDPLDNGDTRWEFALLRPTPEGRED